MSSIGTLPISVIVPVKNEEANLPKCLEKLKRFSEVIVVDSSSTDQTPKIAREFGTKYLNFVWNGQYPKKRNWVLLNQALINEWVLFLDADEFVDDTFCSAIEKAIQTNDHSGYWINYSNYFLNRPLKHGISQRKLALFRVGSALYEKIEEDGWSSLDMEIHEHPIVDGTVGEIFEKVEHNDDRGISKFIDRHRDYAAWEARRVGLLGSPDSSAWSNLTVRQKFKYKNLANWWYPWFYFLGQYFGKFGFLDGKAGFLYAFYKAWYFQTIQILIKERHADCD